MAVNAESWTQNKFFVRLRKEADLEGETFFSPELMEEALNSAITDCEQLVIDQFSDYLLTYEDYDLTASQSYLEPPSDIYLSRIRWIHFRKNGFANLTDQSSGEAYKIKKIPLGDIEDLTAEEAYRYRIINNATNGIRIYLYPYVRSADAGSGRVRLWYIRRFKRLFSTSDITDVPVPEYLLYHVLSKVLFKEGHPFYREAKAELIKQETKLINTLKQLTDDEEDSQLEPTEEVMEEYQGHIY